MQDQVGEQRWPETHRIAGQLVWKYPDYYLFILQKGIYLKAGKNNWPVKYDKGELNSYGIGLNRELYKAVMKSDRDLIVYNKKKDEFYRLDDEEIVAEAANIDKVGGRELVITPLDAYEEIEDKEVPDIENVKRRRLRSNYP